MFKHSAIMLLAFTMTLTAVAGSFDLTWRTIDGGGGVSSAGDLVLSGTIGQPDAGMMSGGDFVLVGGFWAGQVPPSATNCPADLNQDGTVDLGDLLQLLSLWGPCPGCMADLNGDGVVDLSDLLAVLSAWGPCPE